MRGRGVAEIVRLSSAADAKELLAALRAAGVEANRRDARTIVVRGEDEDLYAELVFFVRAWAESRPVEFDVESGDDPRAR